MSGALALVRASWGTAKSYRMGMFVSLAALTFQVVPTYYIGHTLQPFMGPKIAGQGADYFTFLVVGTMTYLLIAAAVDALPRAIERGLSAGTVETLFSTPASTGALVVGLSGYELLWAVAKATLVLLVAAAARAQIAWLAVPAVAGIFALVVLAYFGIGLAAAGCILAFRRAGPLQTIAIVGSALLGGVTYPTSLIPAAVRGWSSWVPMTYALRAARRLLIDGAGAATVAGDAAVLLAFAAALLAAGAVVFVVGLRYARRTGTLGQY